MNVNVKLLSSISYDFDVKLRRNTTGQVKISMYCCIVDQRSFSTRAKRKDILELRYQNFRSSSYGGAHVCSDTLHKNDDFMSPK